MYFENVNFFSDLSKKKVELLKKNFLGYLISSMLAGLYVGFGIVLILSIGGQLFLENSPFLKFIMGISFGIALTLVIFAGSELYTGNTMIMTFGVVNRNVKFLDLILVWIVSYIGNLIGSLFIAYLVYVSGSLNSFDLLLEKVSLAKGSLPILPLLIRGFLCNLLVCLAIWMSGRTKEDSAKIFLIFWCLFGFIGSGFEHSIANMSLLGMGVFQKSLSWGGFFYNLLWVTIGNTIAGVILAFSYYLISLRKN
ncbi:formate/nitrite transporter family protein [Thermospira aquatica]|uniref:Formate/nitrite transporter family protein n=1 Tax=Thermospira aquatica TaxID=2828656 RepID=A0AAX3BAV7_9SPIR|nr:formate/nitrite transporter family protein [Thermospira aquatica]URA09240.1 formate/nitrite transporter family protein [Thermospira aquatica]